MSEAQRSAYARYSQKWVLPFEESCISWSSLFPGTEKRIVDIGFGMGEATRTVASEHPEWGILGIEVHKPGIGKLLWYIHQEKLNNIRIVENDAVKVVADMLAPASVDAFHIWFPDPWPKKRHHKRRLLQPDFVSLCASRLKSGGCIHMATDWSHYAEYVLEVFSQNPHLKNTCKDWAPRPEYRPQTKFEKKGLAEGRTIRDIIFTKVDT